MDFSDHLIAEQSVYAYLNVDKQSPEQTEFQRSVNTFYKYSKDLYTRLTDIEPNDFSITNLPDTIAFLPQNSIFNNILMIRKEDPDFRFVPISETRDVFERNMLPTIVSDETLTMFAPKTDAPRKKMFMNEFPLDTPASLLQSTNPTNLVYDDPDFSNVRDVTTLNGYNALATTVAGIIQSSPDPNVMNNEWVMSLLDLYPLNSNDYRAIISDENSHINRTTITFKIINELSSIRKTNRDRDEQFVRIKSLLDEYVAQLQPTAEGRLAQADAERVANQQANLQMA
ncbi:putative transposase [Drosophila innubila nudivirus]|uniref:Putative transposase n=1 Tax=Drosophila innubila nudivirus TaxID=2057187 RepID=A0A2H4UX47_9VIRU|nr:putative transposase [Drosophila innubila nudivirus]ATZ81489.1 putative transposase [Drosophila innubila nudivirus]